MIFSWLASLGLATKLAVGASAVTVGVAGAGAAGVLPPVAQEAFDEVIAPIEEPVAEPVEEQPVAEVPLPDEPVEGTPDAGTDEDTDGGADGNVPQDDSTEDLVTDENVTHGDKVSAVAQDKTLQGREHGQAVSAAARDKSDEQEKPEDGSVPEDDADDAEDEEEPATDDTEVDVKPAKTEKPKKSKGRS